MKVKERMKTWQLSITHDSELDPFALKDIVETAGEIGIRSKS